VEVYLNGESTAIALEGRISCSEKQ